MKCISLKDGELLWTVNTENSVLRSTKKQSLIIHQNKIFFNNSIGDITAVNVDSGDIIWQTPTQSSLLYRDILSLKLSDLVSDGKSIYVITSNNEMLDLIKQGQAVFGISLGPIHTETEAEIHSLYPEKISAKNA